MAPVALPHERPDRLRFAEASHGKPRATESLHLRGPAASKWDGDEKAPAPFLSKPGLRAPLGAAPVTGRALCARLVRALQVCALSLGASHCLDTAAGLEARST